MNPFVAPRTVLFAALVVVLAFPGCSGDNPVEPPDEPPPLPEPDVAAVTVTAPQTQLLGVGATVQLHATAWDSNDQTLADASFTWTSANEQIAAVDTNGLATTTGFGAVTIQATAEEVSGELGLRVFEEGVASVTITAPKTTLVGAGVVIQLRASAQDALGGVIEDTEFVWTSSDPSVATVDTTGVVGSLTHGLTTIQAQAEEVASEIRLEVFPATGTGPESVDDAVVAFIKRRGVPGGAYAVVRNGMLVMARGYGWADRNAGRVVEPDNLFRIASVSKPITAVTTLKLVEDGLLRFDERAFDILADLLPEGGPANLRLLDVTIEQLLHHTAGWDPSLVADPMFRQQAVARAMGVPSPPPAETMVRWLTTQPLQFTPGQRHVYHNVNYLVLGRIIEHVTGTPYEAFVQTEVLAPMGVTRARIGSAKQSERADGEVVYYDTRTGPSVFDDAPGTVTWPYGAFGDLRPMDAHGGWIMSAVDLARFGVAVDGDPSPPEFLAAETHQYMVRDPGFGYGAGWFLNATGWNHSGGLPGTASVLWIRRSGTLFAAVLNRTGPSAFYNDFIGDFLRAADAVPSNAWPERDLFDEYP